MAEDNNFHSGQLAEQAVLTKRECTVSQYRGILVKGYGYMGWVVQNPAASREIFLDQCK